MGKSFGVQISEMGEEETRQRMRKKYRCVLSLIYCLGSLSLASSELELERGEGSVGGGDI